MNFISSTDWHAKIGLKVNSVVTVLQFNRFWLQAPQLYKPLLDTQLHMVLSSLSASTAKDCANCVNIISWDLRVLYTSVVSKQNFSVN